MPLEFFSYRDSESGNQVFEFKAKESINYMGEIAIRLAQIKIESFVIKQLFRNLNPEIF